MDGVAYLIRTIYENDATGVQQPYEQRRMIFCRVESIGRTDFYEGGRSGLNPSIKLTSFAADYAGEEVIEFNGKRYSIYRTYMVPESDDIELYLELKGGTNGEASFY